MSMPTAPGSIINTINGSFWVHENPQEVQEKMEEADSMIDMIRLAGLESTDQEDALDAYTLDLKPSFIVSVRGISQRSFERTFRSMHEAPPIPPIVQAMLDSTNVIEPSMSKDVDHDESCCCEHPAGIHVTDENGFLLGCGDPNCGCPVWHQHEDGPHGH